MKAPTLVWLLLLVVAASGCSTVKKLVGVIEPGEPSVTLKSAETRWLLIKNPRFGDVPSEPEFVWVEEDKVPTTMTTLLRGKGAIIAPPEIVAKYGTPPGGGKISPRQGTIYQSAEAPRPDPVRGNAVLASSPSRTAAAVPVAIPAAAKPEPPKRGFVVYVDASRIVIDLTGVDGLQPGSLVSLRRDRIPIVHPVTGELLGELDEEVATARVTEIRDRFSVAEVQNVAPGSQIQVRDRVFPK